MILRDACDVDFIPFACKDGETSQRVHSVNDDVLTLMRLDDVASTSIRCHFGTMCPLGSV